MVRVIIERLIKKGAENEFWKMASQLRISAVPRVGYVCGETWVNENDPSHCIVISTWLTLDAWEAWERSSEREAVEVALESLLSVPERVTVLRPPRGIEVHVERGAPAA